MLLEEPFNIDERMVMVHELGPFIIKYRWLLACYLLLNCILAEGSSGVLHSLATEKQLRQVGKEESVVCSAVVATDKMQEEWAIVRGSEANAFQAVATRKISVKRLSPGACTDQNYFFIKHAGFSEVVENSKLRIFSAGNKVRLNKITLGTMLSGESILFIDNAMTPFEAEVGKEHIQSYYIEGYNLTPGGSVYIKVSEASGPFSISTSSSSGFGSAIELIVDGDGVVAGRDIWVRYAPTTAGGHTSSIDHSGGGVISQTVNLDGNATALPVEWLFFRASRQEGNIVLDWATALEKNNSHFEVELSKNPLNGFEKIGQVESKEGNSQSATYYRFKYYLRDVVGTCYFRLKQVDTDQAFDYSRILAVEMDEIKGLNLNVAPNPLKQSSQLSIAVAEAGELHMLILAMDGASVYSKTFALDAGQNKVQFHLNEKVAAGVYIVSAAFKGQVGRLKLIKE